MTMDLIVIYLMVLLLSVSYGQTITYTISEDESPRLLGNIASSANLSDVVGIDEIPALRYTMVTTDAKIVGLFNLDENSGDLFTSTKVDREGLCGQAVTCVIDLDVAAQSFLSTVFRKIKVLLYIDDANDNPPQFPQSMLQIEISETAAVGSTIRVPIASDADATPINRISRYELSQEDGGVFELLETRTGSTVTALSIQLKSDLDREQKEQYKLAVTAFDGGDPAQSTNLTVVVLVTDENDNKPVFQRFTFDATLTETVGLDSSILKLEASDLDKGENSKITYHFASSVPTPVSTYFKLNPETGVISTKSSLDGAGGSTFIFQVIAKDNGSPRLTSESEVVIKIIDTNNDPPEIKVQLLFSQGGSSTVPESSIIGRVVALVTVKETDSGNNGLVDCAIRNNYFSIQEMNVLEYKVIVAKPFNREETPIHNVTVTCTDSGSPPLTTRSDFQVRILDENDNSPQFPQETYFFNIKEKNKIDQFVGKVRAYDNDTNENAQLTYQLINGTDYFTINSTSGEIKAITSIDRESIPKFVIQVKAVDNGKIPLSGTTIVKINIDDVNDNAPELSAKSYVFHVAEDARIGSYIGFLTATDADIGMNADVTYALDYSSVDHNVPFTVLTNGTVVSTDEVDFEKQPQYSFKIYAKDRGTPSLNSTAILTIIIMDINDNIPVIYFPAENNNSINVPHTMGLGAEIAQIQAYDIDSGDNRRLSYSISVVNDTNLFTINVESGTITLSRDMDAKDIQSYVINIEVHDNGQVQLSTRASMEIQVVRGDALPVVGGNNHSTNVAIVVVLICVTLVLAIAVIVTVCLIRRIDNKKKQCLESKPEAQEDWYEKPQVDNTVVPVSNNFPEDKTTKKSVKFVTESENIESLYAQVNKNRPRKANKETSKGYTNKAFNEEHQQHVSFADEISNIAALQNHQALVRILKLGDREEKMNDIDVWSDVSADHTASDSGHGDSDLDLHTVKV
ncbi:hypothetical protein SNE40_016702 [Patella caerulea]|uniref:Cadherin domain-containing protein n=1 Tax=Patella caerulea TaxID=87958 RepID=A0AAN8J916_PATCE